MSHNCVGPAAGSLNGMKPPVVVGAPIVLLLTSNRACWIIFTVDGTALGLGMLGEGSTSRLISGIMARCVMALVALLFVEAKPSWPLCCEVLALGVASRLAVTSAFEVASTVCSSFPLFKLTPSAGLADVELKRLGCSEVLVLDEVSGLVVMASSKVASTLRSAFVLVKLLPSAGLADIELVTPSCSEVLVLDAASGLVTPLVAISS